MNAVKTNLLVVTVRSGEDAASPARFRRCLEARWIQTGDSLRMKWIVVYRDSKYSPDNTPVQKAA